MSKGEVVATTIVSCVGFALFVIISGNIFYGCGRGDGAAEVRREAILTGHAEAGPDPHPGYRREWKWRAPGDNIFAPSEKTK